jgi:sec-independent protein translocase protein TatA
MEFPMHWLIILVVILVLFGGRKIPELMRGMGEGVRGFKEGMSGGHGNQTQSQTVQPQSQPPAPVEKSSEEKKA